MTELILYTHPKSRGRVARWMLEEVGHPYHVRALAFGAEMHSAEFLALNPMGKVPVVTYGGDLVTETAAICLWAAETFPAAGLAPLPSERAACYRWLFFAAGPLEQAIAARAAGVEPAGDQRVASGFGDFDTTVATLAGWLTDHDHVAGDRFTAADVYVGAQVMYGLQFGLLPQHPALTGLRDRLAARPAFLRAGALDDALA